MTKSEVVHFKKNFNFRKDKFSQNAYFNGQMAYSKCLGICIDNHLNFNKQADFIVNKIKIKLFKAFKCY